MTEIQTAEQSADPNIFQQTGERYTHFISTTNNTAKNLYVTIKAITHVNLPYRFDTIEKVRLLQNVYDQIETCVAGFEKYQSDIAAQLAAMEQNGNTKGKKGVFNRDVDAFNKTKKEELQKKYYDVREGIVTIKLTTPVKEYLEQAIKSSLTCESFMQEVTIDTQQTKNFVDVNTAIENIKPIGDLDQDLADQQAQAEADYAAAAAEAEQAAKANDEAEQQRFEDANRPDEGGEQGEDL